MRRCARRKHCNRLPLEEDPWTVRKFSKTLAAGVATAVAPFSVVRAQGSKLKVGVLLPRSGVQALIGQSCQKGADLAPEVIRQILGVDVELMNADTEETTQVVSAKAVQKAIRTHVSERFRSLNLKALRIGIGLGRRVHG